MEDKDEARILFEKEWAALKEFNPIFTNFMEASAVIVIFRLFFEIAYAHGQRAEMKRARETLIQAIASRAQPTPLDHAED